MSGIPNNVMERNARSASLVFDPQAYLHFLEDCDWTEDQKREFIEALWQIVVSFVDLGFELHPVQRVIGTSSALEPDSSSVLDSPHLQKFETTHAGFDHRVDAGRPDS